MIKPALKAGLLTVTLGLLCACSTSSNMPAVSYDGLELVPDSKFATVYRRPGARLDGFEAYGLADCQVAFRKDWLRNQNNNRISLSSRVTQKDVDRIKDTLSSECDKYFREALQAPPPYQLVDSFADGENVLILRPAIINLDVSAPDTNSAGMQRAYTTSAGEMTLLLELLDATTGEVLVRIVDRRQAMDTGRMQWSNSVTNAAEAKRVLRRWAEQLRKGLDSVTEHPEKQS
jgi:hypothetical protein